MLTQPGLTTQKSNIRNFARVILYHQNYYREKLELQLLMFTREAT